MVQSSPIVISYKLKFDGRDADKHLLEAHPAGHSIEGLSWALALTVNYGITGRIRYSRGLERSSKIFISPPKRGSVIYDLNILVQEHPALAILLGGYAVNTVTPFINGLIKYVFGQAMGVTSEFTTDARKYLEKLNGEDLNAITQRVEPPLTRAHTVIGRTADKITLQNKRLSIAELDPETKENLTAKPTQRFDDIDTNVTSFNLLTGNGRLYSRETETTVPFSLARTTKSGTATALISSMEQFSLGRNGTIRIVAERVETLGGRLTKYLIASAEEVPEIDWIDGIDPLRSARS